MKGTKSIFIKIVALFLAFIVPIYILGFCIFFWGKTTITRYINDAEVTQVQTIMEGFQKDIEQIQSLQYNIFQDND
ncbi:MAG: hypothetical protein PUC59_10855, partial [Firmicutes bacterium]|nr:hypothetical protein [Bacillota bacterium]